MDVSHCDVMPCLHRGFEFTWRYPFSHACLIDRIPGQTNSLKHKVIVLNVLRCIGGMPEQSGSIYVRFISTKSFARPRQAVGPMQTHLGHNIFAHALLVIYITFPKCCCLRNFVLRYQCVEKISTKCLEIFPTHWYLTMKSLRMRLNHDIIHVIHIIMMVTFSPPPPPPPPLPGLVKYRACS